MPDDRDQQFERALARLLRDASPASHCPDAEILSAYEERTLPPGQMAALKEHIAGCVPCQEVLALVEQSENVHLEEWQNESVPVLAAAKPVPAAQTAFRGTAPARVASEISAKIPAIRTRANWRWLAPIGAIAAGLIAWVGVNEVKIQHHNEQQSVQTARNLQTEPALTAPPTAPSAAITDQGKQQPTASLQQNLRDRKDLPASLPAEQKRQLAAPSAAASVPRNREPLRSPRVSAGTVSNIPVASLPAPADSLDASRQAAKQIAAPPPPPAPESQSGVQGGVAAKSAPAPQAMRKAQISSSAQTVEVQPAQQLLDADSLARNALAYAPRMIVAPDEKFQWRIGQGGKIAHSTDHGKTWKLQTSGVSFDLTSGSAVSDKICWIVGKAGTVLLTTDGGEHWNRFSSPAFEDSVRIYATDALHASISDASGRVIFETSDGGATWQRLPN